MNPPHVGVHQTQEMMATTSLEAMLALDDPQLLLSNKHEI